MDESERDMLPGMLMDVVVIQRATTGADRLGFTGPETSGVYIEARNDADHPFGLGLTDRAAMRVITGLADIYDLEVRPAPPDAPG